MLFKDYADIFSLVPYLSPSNSGHWKYCGPHECIFLQLVLELLENKDHRSVQCLIKMIFAWRYLLVPGHPLPVTSALLCNEGGDMNLGYLDE